MNTNELVEKLATEHDVPKNEAKALVAGLLELIAVASLPGFGKFKVAERAAREGRNPAMGAVIQIEASRKLTFVPAKQVKDRLTTASG